MENYNLVIQKNGYTYYLLELLHHRTDGPAIENSELNIAVFYLYGEVLSFDIWLINLDVDPLEKVLFKLKWGGTQ